MIADLLSRFEPEPDGLLRQMSEHVSDEVLEWISIADYGEDADEHLIALRKLRDTGTFPKEMQWCPAEVLELIRWSEPEDPDWKPGRTGESGHWMRAFSCAALLRATREPWNYGDGLGTDSTLVQLILSLCALPIDFTMQTVKFLAWLLLHSDPEGRDEQVCAYGIGLFWFALKHPTPFPDDVLISLAQWVTLRAGELYQESPSAGGPGLHEMVIKCQKRSSWERLGLKLLDLDLSVQSSELRAWINVIGKQLLG
jgi:hypothetical protein